ncbi:MAG: HEAT repeat domain-containing protein [Planctomycetes bacterium]|nr:HEAT repeat domain-containing protein [Planctomycetota bacterium]
MRSSRRIMFSLAVTVLATAVATAAYGQEDDSAPASSTDELRILSGLLTRPGVTLETRRDAAALLLAKGDRATPILAAALDKSDSPDLQMAVLQAIAADAEPPAGLLAALQKLSASENLAAGMQEPLGSALSAYRSREALREMLDLLAHSESPRQKQILIAVLGRIGEKEAVQPLIDLLRSDEPAIRSSAAAALSSITQAYLGESHETWTQWWQEHKDEPRGKWLFERLRAQEAQLAKQTAELDEVTRRLVEVHQANLRKTEPAKRLAEVVKLLDDPLPALRQLAAAEARTLLREAKEPLAPLVDKLLARATDDAAAVREEVAATLAATKDKRAAELLVARLGTEPEPSVRGAIVKALGELREGQAVGELVKLLDGGDETLMLRAIESLGQIGERGAESASAVGPALKPLAQLLDRSGKPAAGEAVREAVARTLSRIARDESLPALIRALDDSAAKVRFFAAQGLGNVGKDNAKAIEALLNHLSDTDKGVRAAVADTLGRIGNGQAASAIASRLAPGGESEKDVRQTLAGALLAIERRSDNPQTIERLGDELAASGDADSLKWAVQLYDLSVSKMGTNGNGHLAHLKEKLADASLRSGQANKAVSLLRELVEAEKDAARRQALQQKLGRVLITIPPYVEGVDLLVKAIQSAPADKRAALLQDIHDQTRRLKDEGKPADAYLIISRARRALDRTWSVEADVAARMETLYLTVGRAVFDRVLQQLDAEDEAVRKQALDQATQVVSGEPQLLVTRLTQALTDGDASRVARLEKLLPALGRDLAAYNAAATHEAKLAIVKTWGQAPPQEQN